MSTYANLSDATPSNVAGRPAYTLRMEPKRHGGLLGGAALAWDAVTGAPLRAAIYAKGQSDPVLEIKATSVDFGAVPASTFAIAPPADAKVVDVQHADRPGPEGSDEGTGAGDRPRGRAVARRVHGHGARHACGDAAQ